ncbi:hypothetical protein AAH678_00255 [Sodalis endosymbiont of Spalangia cameroni]|uniref:hypothetical protein n=1 Tax=Sodalis praecaptivus TaxID=1239307 RepID=UPI0031F993AB
MRARLGSTFCAKRAFAPAFAPVPQGRYPLGKTDRHARAAALIEAARAEPLIDVKDPPSMAVQSIAFPFKMIKMPSLPPRNVACHDIARD